MTGLQKDSMIKIVFKYLGKPFLVKAYKNQTLLEAAHSNKIPLEGACEGNLACSTCQVYCDKSIFNEKNVSEREMDLLEKAYQPKYNSRLACQIKIDEKLHKKIFEIPKYTRNII